MKKSLIPLILLLGIFCLTTCEKDSVDPGQDNQALDTLSENRIALLDALEIDNTTKLADLTFDDGTNVLAFLKDNDPEFLTEFGRTRDTKDLPLDEKLKLYLGEMAGVGMRLTDRPKHRYKRSDNVNQYGLAYSFGSIQYQNAQFPAAVDPKHPEKSCNTSIKFYGLDCAGMIYQMATKAGIDFSGFLKRGDKVKGSKYLGDTSSWNQAFKLTSDLKHLRTYYADIKTQPIQVKFGDVLSWNGHVGIVLKKNDLIKIFQSNGYAEPSPEHDCKANFDEKHGPTIVNLTGGFLADFGPYKILRFSDVFVLNLTKGSHKTWKTNPNGQTFYCGLNQVNLPVAMDDKFTFDINGTFTHNGGAITSAENCSDGGTYSGSYSLSPDRKTLFFGSVGCQITMISENNLKVVTGDGTLDLIPE